MADELLMGIDAGTSRVRVLVFEMDGTVVAQGSSDPVVHRPTPGWASTKSEDLWSSCHHAIKMAVSDIENPHRIRSIAVASVGEAAVPLDRKGNPLYPMIAWYDARTGTQAKWLEKKIGKQRLFEITGMYPYPFFGICKQMWIRDHEPEVFSKTISWLNTADFLTWKLCGIPATDFSLASRTFALNIHSLKYAEDLLEEVGIPVSWYQNLVPSGSFLGTVLPGLACEIGLDRTCSVSAGGHDHFVGALTAGALNHGTLTDSMGTAESLTVFMDKPMKDTSVGVSGYTQGVIYVDKPYYYFDGGFFTSGAAVQWFHQLMGNNFSHIELIEKAGKISAGSDGLLFMPYLKFGSPPNPAEQSKGTLLGLGTETNYISIYRSILEGMACNVRMIVEGMMKYPEFPSIRRIHCFGGESQNPLLLKIKASVMNRSLIRLDITESVSLGAAILGAIGAGLYKNFDDAPSSNELGSEEIIPQAEWIEYYQKHYENVFTSAWEQIRPLQRKIFENHSISVNSF